jgi:hypothetical protein
VSKSLALLALMFAAPHAFAEVNPNLDDGQVLAVGGWINQMPGNGPVTLPQTHVLVATFAAISGGCTSAKDFALKLAEQPNGDYVISAVRTKLDPCEATPHVVYLQGSLQAPVALFQKVSQRQARILVEPSVSVGIAY